jgi:hypothetical protein
VRKGQRATSPEVHDTWLQLPTTLHPHNTARCRCPNTCCTTMAEWLNYGSGDNQAGRRPQYKDYASDVPPFTFYLIRRTPER